MSKDKWHSVYLDKEVIKELKNRIIVYAKMKFDKNMSQKIQALLNIYDEQEAILQELEAEKQKNVELEAKNARLIEKYTN